MSAKFGASRRHAFLTALAATGNQTLAAERARVSRSWVTANRARDAGFDAAVRAAIEEAKVMLRQAQHDPSTGSGRADSGGSGMKPQSGWVYLAGAELVVRGTGGAALGPTPAGGKRVQIARARVRQWSPRAEERFLLALTACCNVKAACAEVGLTPASAYNHRLRWPMFAQRWDAALRLGYDQIECALIEAGCNLFSPELHGELPPIRGMTFAQAIHLLHMHKHAARGLGKAPGLPPRAVDIEELRAQILHRIGVMQRTAP